MRYPLEEGRLEKERAAIREPKNGFPWIPTLSEVDVSRGSDCTALNDDIGEPMASYVPPVTVYPSARRFFTQILSHLRCSFERASGSDAG
jgi:hypothetical protein